MEPALTSDTFTASAPAPGRRLAWVLAGLCALGACASPLVNALVWMGPDAFHDPALLKLTGAVGAGWFDWPIRIGATAITSVEALLLAYGLWRLRTFFLCSATGRALSGPALGGFRAFAWIMAALVVVRPIELAALSAFLSWCEPSEGGQVMVDFGTRDLVLLFFALVFVSVAHVLQHAIRQQDELDSFI